MLNLKKMKEMKKKLLSILLGLFLSTGVAYPSCYVLLSCTKVTTVCMEYYLQGNSSSDYEKAKKEYNSYLNELQSIMCPDDSIYEDEPVEE